MIKHSRLKKERKEENDGRERKRRQSSISK